MTDLDTAALRDAIAADARLAAYVERTVAEAPPLTAEQRDRIALLLRGSDKPMRREPSQADRDRWAAEAAARAERGRREAAVRKAVREAQACAVCGVPQPGHMPASMAQHGWEPRGDL